MGPSNTSGKGLIGLRTAVWVAALLAAVSSTGCFCRTRTIALGAVDRTRPPEMNASLLGAEGPTRLVVHVDWIEGCEPEAHALRELRKWLVRVTGRPKEAIVVERGGVVAAEPGRGLAAIEATVKKNAAPAEDAHFVYVLYWDRWERYRGVYFPARGLDRRIGHETVVMFVDPIERQSVLWVTRRKVEAAVLVHEFGHGAGLVTSGAHSDGNGHCSDPSCRMYWGVDGASMRKNLFPVLCRGVLPPGAFCARCEADLALGRTPNPSPSQE